MFWTLYFDGYGSNDGAGEGCVLISPNGERKIISCRLEFECTNNDVVEYEAMVQGLYKAITLDFQYLQVFGDT